MVQLRDEGVSLLRGIATRAVKSAQEAVREIPPGVRGELIRAREGDTTRLVDDVAERAIFATLENASQKHGIAFHVLSEEQGEALHVIGSGDRVVYGILDPTDGSKNITSNIPIGSSNIALTFPFEKGGFLPSQLTLGHFLAAAVADLYSERVFSAVRGQGAHEERKQYPIAGEDDSLRFDVKRRQVHTLVSLFASTVSDLTNARLLLDSYTAIDREACERAFFPLRLAVIDAGRFYGSGIESISLVSEKGVLPGYAGYVGCDQSLDNIAAGKIIFEEAGGFVTDWDGDSLDDVRIYGADGKPARPSIVFAPTPGLAVETLRVLQRSEPLNVNGVDPLVARVMLSYLQTHGDRMREGINMYTIAHPKRGFSFMSALEADATLQYLAKVGKLTQIPTARGAHNYAVNPNSE